MTELLMRNKFSPTAFRIIFMITNSMNYPVFDDILSVSNWTAHLMNMSRELTQAYIQKSKLTLTN